MPKISPVRTVLAGFLGFNRKETEMNTQKSNTLDEGFMPFDPEAVSEAVRAAQQAYLSELSEQSANAVLTQATISVWAAGVNSAVSAGLCAASITGAVLTAGSPLMIPLTTFATTSGIRAVLNGVACYQAVQYRGELRRGEVREIDLIKDTKRGTWMAALGLTLDVVDTAVFVSIPLLGGPNLAYVGAGFSGIRSLFGAAQVANGVKTSRALKAETVVEEEAPKPGAHKAGIFGSV